MASFNSIKRSFSTLRQSIDVCRSSGVSFLSSTTLCRHSNFVNPCLVSPALSIRTLHSSSPLYAKGGNKGGKDKGKKGKGGKNDSDDEDEEVSKPVVLPDVTVYGAKMDKALGRLAEDFKKMRGELKFNGCLCVHRKSYLHNSLTLISPASC